MEIKSTITFLISDKTNFKLKIVNGDKKELHVDKRSTQQEDIEIINMHSIQNHSEL